MAAVSALAPPSPAPAQIPGVIGEDDRVPVDGQQPPWQAIGHVNVAGYRTRGQCTGTLVAPRVAVTAAHCLVNGRTGSFFRPVDIHFLPGVTRGQYLTHAQPACVRRLPAWTGEAAGIDRLRGDAVALIFDEPVPVPPISVTAERGEPADRPLIHAAYPSTRRQLLSVEDGCRVIGGDALLWRTSCDTSPGSSGGPLLTRAGDGGETLSVAAIVIAYRRGTGTLAVPADTWRHLVVDPSCP